VEHQLHASTLIEKTLRDNSGQGWNSAKHGAARDDVTDHLLCAAIVDTALFFEPSNSLCYRWVGLADVTRKQIPGARINLRAKIRDTLR
jgi:hypothetical protein